MDSRPGGHQQRERVRYRRRIARGLRAGMSKLQVAAGRWMLLLGLPGWDGAWGNVAQGVEGGAASGVSGQGEVRWM